MFVYDLVIFIWIYNIPIHSWKDSAQSRTNTSKQSSMAIEQASETYDGWTNVRQQYYATLAGNQIFVNNSLIWFTFFHHSKFSCRFTRIFDWLDVTGYAHIEIKFHTIGIGTTYQRSSLMDWFNKLDCRIVRFDMLWILYGPIGIEKISMFFSITTCCLLGIDLFWDDILIHFNCPANKWFDCWWCSWNGHFIRIGNCRQWVWVQKEIVRQYSKISPFFCTHRIRGRLGSFAPFLRNVGTLIGYILGTNVKYEYVPLINLIIPFLFGILFMGLPNTPRYYLHKGKIQVRKTVL